MNRMKKRMAVLLAPVLAWLYPVVFLYAQNAREIAIAETVTPAGIFLLCAAVIVLLGRLLYKDWKMASLFSAITGVFLVNFDLILAFIQKLMPILRYWHVIYLAVILAVGLCELIKRFSLAEDGLRVVNLLFGALILFNLVTALPVIVQRVVDRQAEKVNISQETNVEEGQRNIYYILCDEYASFEQMEAQFGFDNMELKNQVKDLGFNISETSRNDTYHTTVVMANVMQLDYVATTKSTSVELENLTKNGNLQRILLENGYQLRGIGKTEWMGFPGTVEVTSGATTAEGASMSDIVLERSFLKPFTARDYVAAAQEKAEALESFKNMTITPDTSSFFMCYFDVPHHPYYFDENGRMNPASKWSNDETGRNNDAYIGMVKFANKSVLPVVQRIVKEDPNAIILWGSDHGNRQGKAEESMKFQILNMLYYGGEEVPEFEGLSSVNTFRMILNREFGLEMEYIALP